jgi:hypothetical protein
LPPLDIQEHTFDVKKEYLNFALIFDGLSQLTDITSNSSMLSDSELSKVSIKFDFLSIFL